MNGVGSFPLSGASQALSTTNRVYFGFSVRETNNAIATIRIRAGGVITGDILDTIQLNPNESAREWYGPQGIQAHGGLYVEKVAGTYEGSVRAL